MLYALVEAVVNTALASRQLIIVVVTVVITLPLSLYRDVAKISKVSGSCHILPIICCEVSYK